MSGISGHIRGDGEIRDLSDLFKSEIQQSFMQAVRAVGCEAGPRGTKNRYCIIAAWHIANVNASAMGHNRDRFDGTFVTTSLTPGAPRSSSVKPAPIIHISS